MSHVNVLIPTRPCRGCMKKSEKLLQPLMRYFTETEKYWKNEHRWRWQQVSSHCLIVPVAKITVPRDPVAQQSCPSAETKLPGLKDVTPGCAYNVFGDLERWRRIRCVHLHIYQYWQYWWSEIPITKHCPVGRIGNPLHGYTWIILKTQDHSLFVLGLPGCVIDIAWHVSNFPSE